MTEKQKRPYEEVHLMTSLFLSLFLSAAWSLTISIENLQIAKKNKAKYQEEMELYKQQKDEEAEDLKKGEEEQMKIQKHEALQLLKKKEKTENIIKVLQRCHHKFVGIVGFKTYSAANLWFEYRKPRRIARRRRSRRKRPTLIQTSLRSRHPHSSYSGIYQSGIFFGIFWLFRL